MSDWLTFSPISGTGNGQITLTASSMSELNFRVETLVATNNQHSLTATANILQSIPPSSITFDSFEIKWIKDIPYTGGVATKSNCNFKVYAIYGDGTELDITDLANITGSLTVPPTTSKFRSMVGALELYVDFEGVTASAEVDAYQEKMPYDWSNEYLTFEIVYGGNIYWGSSDKSFVRTIEYSKNGGEWTEITSTTGYGTPISVVAGDVLRFKGTNTAYGSSSGSPATSKCCGFGYHDGSARYKAYGNIMSLVGGDNFSELTEVSDYAFTNFFFANWNLLSIENLVLPATTLGKYCYTSMFYWCLGVSTAPELPATTLSEGCYNNMFYRNESLLKAPELPATTLTPKCYRYMFTDCSSLNYIKCLATTNIGMLNTTDYWVSGVSGSGTFVKNPNMNDWTTGTSGIPTGWTVINDS